MADSKFEQKISHSTNATISYLPKASIQTKTSYENLYNETVTKSTEGETTKYIVTSDARTNFINQVSKSNLNDMEKKYLKELASSPIFGIWMDPESFAEIKKSDKNNVLKEISSPVDFYKDVNFTFEKNKNTNRIDISFNYKNIIGSEKDSFSLTEVITNRAGYGEAASDKDITKSNQPSELYKIDKRAKNAFIQNALLTGINTSNLKGVLFLDFNKVKDFELALKNTICSNPNSCSESESSQIKDILKIISEIKLNGLTVKLEGESSICLINDFGIAEQPTTEFINFRIKHTTYHELSHFKHKSENPNKPNYSSDIRNHKNFSGLTENQEKDTENVYKESYAEARANLLTLFENRNDPKKFYEAKQWLYNLYRTSNVNDNPNTVIYRTIAQQIISRENINNLKTQDDLENHAFMYADIMTLTFLNTINKQKTN